MSNKSIGKNNMCIRSDYSELHMYTYNQKTNRIHMYVHMIDKINNRKHKQSIEKVSYTYDQTYPHEYRLGKNLNVCI